MRILYWTELFYPYIGGVEVLGAQFVSALAQCGHDIEVVTSHGSLELPDRDEFQGTTIHRFPFLSALQSRDPVRIWDVRKAVSSLKAAPQVVW